ncbi:MAG: CBS domain-containing protein [Hyphomicrobiales bacterium]|nr:CBS domain-containing protein [Hyphomicrobiales bacterium]
MKAAELMTSPAVTISSDAKIDDAVRLMIDRKLSGLPVVDAYGRLAGILTEGDLLRRAELGTQRKRPRWLEFLFGPGVEALDYVHAHGRRVSEIMSDNPVWVLERTPIEEIVELMEKKHVKRLPVLRDEKIVGVVARADIVRGLAQQKMVLAPKSDREIRDRILGELRAQKWAPIGLIGIDVEHGEVTLSGAILDEREREAVRVLVENTPGVQKLHDHLAWVGPEGMYVEAPRDRP